MNRPYRGKRCDGKGWVKGGYYELYVLYDEGHEELQYDEPRLAYFIQPDDNPAEEVIPESVGQSTGRQDVKGTDAYGGDKIKSIHKDYPGVGVIAWHGNGWAVEVDGDKVLYSRNYPFQVIGTIHDKEAKE